MAKPKMTPWFNALTQPPVRVGWYEMDWALHRKWWDGKQWCWEPGDPLGLVSYHDEWRGLAKPPKDTT